MFQKLVLSVCLLALAGAAPAATKKAAKAEEPESALSKVLAGPVAQALEGLEAMQASAKQKKRPALLLRQAENLKQDLKEQLEKLRNARVGDDEAASKDAAIVAVAAGLRAADLIAIGLKDDDDDQLQSGYLLGEMAIADLQNLDAGGEEAALGGGGDADGGGYEIGPSLGADFSLGSQTNAFNMSTNLSMSLPVSRAMDVGAGFNLGLNSSDDGKTSSVAMNLGLNGFTRYHFLDAFAQSPWMVPYVGGKLGWQSNDSSSYTSGSYSSSSSSSSGTSLGLQLGMLFFVNKKTAMTLQGESSTNNSSSGSSSSLTLSLGARMML